VKLAMIALQQKRWRDWRRANSVSSAALQALMKNYDNIIFPQKNGLL
jgi:hypothetical protein